MTSAQLSFIVEPIEAEARHLDIPTEEIATPFTLGSADELSSLLHSTGFPHIDIAPESRAHRGRVCVAVEARTNLARELRDIEPRARASSWAGREHYRGYAVMSLPFSSSHQLGLRVFFENDLAPYTSVWHRTPEGDWSIYNDGFSLKTTCPRLWGPALRHADLTRIKLAWTGPNSLRVEMESPKLTWTMSMRESPLLRVLNAVSAALPFWTWKPAPLLRMREWIAKRLLGMGHLRFAFRAPSGHDTTIMPKRIFFIEASKAVWSGQNLGEPVQLEANPIIGGIPMPSRPAFVVGQAYAEIKDREEYEQTSTLLSAGAVRRTDS